MKKSCNEADNMIRGPQGISAGAGHPYPSVIAYIAMCTCYLCRQSSSVGVRTDVEAHSKGEVGVVAVEGAQCGVRQREYQGVEPGGGGRTGIIITPPTVEAAVTGRSSSNYLICTQHLITITFIPPLPSLPPSIPSLHNALRYLIFGGRDSLAD